MRCGFRQEPCKTRRATPGSGEVQQINLSATLSSDNDLAALTISEGSLDPDFSADTTSYSVRVSSGVTSVRLTPTAHHAGATITVNGQSAPSGQESHSISLSSGNNAITITVTAQNGGQKTYNVGVYRPAPLSSGPAPTPEDEPEPSPEPEPAIEPSVVVVVPENVTVTTAADGTTRASADLTADQLQQVIAAATAQQETVVLDFTDQADEVEVALAGAGIQAAETRRMQVVIRSSRGSVRPSTWAQVSRFRSRTLAGTS